MLSMLPGLSLATEFTSPRKQARSALEDYDFAPVLLEAVRRQPPPYLGGWRIVDEGICHRSRQAYRGGLVRPRKQGVAVRNS